MKHTFSRFLCLALTLAMVLSLCACGKDKEPADPNHFDFGKYEVDFKDACIMYNESGEDALVFTFEFTNNSKDAASYGWTIYEKTTQDGVELESTYVITDMETFAGVAEDYFTDVEPGESIEIGTAFAINGLDDEVTIELSDLFDKYTYEITVDPSELERVENEYSDLSDWDWDWDDEDATDDADATDAPAEAPTEAPAEAPTEASQVSGDLPAYLDWWSCGWYGWWIITSGTGEYEGYTSYFWDLCGKLEIANEDSGCFTMWDSDYSYDEPAALILVSFSEAGVGAHGTMYSENGTFFSQTLGHADWIVDPGLEIVDDLLWIDGTYEGNEGSFSYEIYLRPWGVGWDDLPEDAIPYDDPLPGSYDWYVTMVEAGEPMPNSFG